MLQRIGGFVVSMAVEDAPSLSRAVLLRMREQFSLVSNSDQKLAAQTGFSAGDALLLRKPPSHRELRLGPLRLKLRHKAEAVDRSPLERAWFEKILQLHA